MYLHVCVYTDNSKDTHRDMYISMSIYILPTFWLCVTPRQPRTSSSSTAAWAALLHLDRSPTGEHNQKGPAVDDVCTCRYVYICTCMYTYVYVHIPAYPKAFRLQGHL